MQEHVEGAMQALCAKNEETPKRPAGVTEGREYEERGEIGRVKYLGWMAAERVQGAEGRAHSATSRRLLNVSVLMFAVEWWKVAILHRRCASMSNDRQQLVKV